MANTKEVLTRNNFFTTMLTISIVLVFLIGISFAWLTDLKTKEGEAIIGEVAIEFYSNSTRLNGYFDDEQGEYVLGNALEVNLGDLNTAVPIDFTIKNTGTIPGIVKCEVSITTDEGPLNHHTDLEDVKYVVQTNQVNIEYSNWIIYQNYLQVDDLYWFDFYLNEQLVVGGSKPIITSITPRAGGFNNSSVFIKVRASIVAYSGNAYQIDSPENPVADIDKPFGVLPSNFLDNQWTAWKL